MMGVEREADPEAEPSAEAKATTSEQKTLEVFARLLAEAYKNGAAMASSLDYIPLPDAVQAVVRAAWHSQVMSPDGKSIY